MDMIIQSLPESIILKDQYEAYIINSIALSAKFYEVDLNSISFERFIECSNSKYNLHVEDLALNEVNCLKILNYKLNYFSIYDILNLLMDDYLGELLNEDDDYIISIINYPFNILENIILSNITIKYSYIEISFCLIRKTNNYFKLGDDYLEKFNNKYNIKYSDYQECLQNIDNILNSKSKNYYLDFNYKNDEHKKGHIQPNIEKKKNTDINKIYNYLFNISKI